MKQDIGRQDSFVKWGQGKGFARWAVVVLVTGFCLIISGCPPLVFVDGDNTEGEQDGLGWETAFSSIQDAIDYASNAEGEAPAVLVKGGHYPETVTLYTDIGIIGSVAGNEDSLLEAYFNFDVFSNPTVISGSAIEPRALYGADDVTVMGLVITDKGMENNGTSPSLTACIFQGNTAPEGEGLGGAVLNFNGAAPIFLSCIFRENEADFGAALYNAGASPVLANCTIVGNTADVYFSSAIHNVSESNLLMLNTIAWDEEAETSMVCDESSTPYLQTNLLKGWEGEEPILNEHLHPIVRRWGPDPVICPSLDAVGCSDDFLFDVRGMTRPIGGGVDIGAFEVVDTDFPNNFYAMIAFTQDYWNGQSPEEIILPETCPGLVLPEMFYMGMVDWVIAHDDAPYHAETRDAYLGNLTTLLEFFYETERINEGYAHPGCSVISALAVSAVYCYDSYIGFLDAIFDATESMYPEIIWSESGPGLHDLPLTTVEELELYFLGTLRTDMIKTFLMISDGLWYCSCTGEVIEGQPVYQCTNGLCEDDWVRILDPDELWYCSCNKTIALGEEPPTESCEEGECQDDWVRMDFDLSDTDINGREYGDGTPNGIPDIAEFVLMEALLIDFYRQTPAYSEALHNWFGNISLLYNSGIDPSLNDFFQNIECSAIIRLFSAYLTLGGAYSSVVVNNIMYYYFNAVIARDATYGSLDQFLGPYGDADGDDMSNLEEWETTICAYSAIPFDELVEMYVQNALDDSEPGVQTPYRYTLNCVVEGRGDFSVTGAPSTFKKFEAVYCQGVYVTLNALAAPNWEFVEWIVNGQPDSTLNSLVLNMDEDKQVIAVFERNMTEATIVDNVLYQIVCDIVDGPEGEPDCEPSVNDLANISELDLSETSGYCIECIDSIEGIEYMVSLVELDLSALTHCVDLTPLLDLTEPGNNSELTHLYLPSCSELGQAWACHIIPILEQRGVAVFSDAICASEINDDSILYSVYLPKKPPTEVVKREDYPRLANYYHHVSLETEPHESLGNMMAQWDIMIISPVAASAYEIDLLGMKDINPRNMLFAYSPLIGASISLVNQEEWYLHCGDFGVYCCENSISPGCENCVDYCNGCNWAYVCTSNNNRMSQTGNGREPYAMNMITSSGYPDALLNLFIRSHVGANCIFPGYDGIFFDCPGDRPNYPECVIYEPEEGETCDTNEGEICQLYKEGVEYLFGHLIENDLIVSMNNARPFPAGHSYYTYVYADMIENALGNKFGGFGYNFCWPPDEEGVECVPVSWWQCFWNFYRRSMNEYRRLEIPGANLFIADLQFDRGVYEASLVSDLTQWDLQRMRLGLCTTLLDDGFFGFDRGDFLHGQLWWFDEYSTDLGNPMPYHQHGDLGRDVYYYVEEGEPDPNRECIACNRDFERGIVIVNTNETNWAHPDDCGCGCPDEGEGEGEGEGECVPNHDPFPSPWEATINPILPGLYRDATTGRVGMCFDIPGMDGRIFEKGYWDGEIYVPYTYLDVVDFLAQNSTAINFDPRLRALIELITTPYADFNGRLEFDLLSVEPVLLTHQGNGIPDIAGELGLMARFMNEPELIVGALDHPTIIEACSSSAKILFNEYPIAWKILGVLAPELRDLAVAYHAIGCGNAYGGCDENNGVYDCWGPMGVVTIIMELAEQLGVEYPSLSSYASQIAVELGSWGNDSLSSLQDIGDADGDGCLNNCEWHMTDLDPPGNLSLEDRVALYLNWALEDDECDVYPPAVCVEVPNVVGQPEALAVAAIENANMTAKVIYEPTAYSGNVDSQLPVGGQSAAPVSTIYLLVDSAGQ